MDFGEELRLMRLRAAVLLARSHEARARANATLAHARLLREDSAALIQCADDLRSNSKPPDHSLEPALPDAPPPSRRYAPLGGMIRKRL
jgi:hypothetical protein